MGNRVYAVVVEQKYQYMGYGKLSQDAFSTLEKAQAFIEGRVPTPKQVTPMMYEDRHGLVYKIHDLLVK